MMLSLKLNFGCAAQAIAPRIDWPHAVKSQRAQQFFVTCGRQTLHLKPCTAPERAPRSRNGAQRAQSANEAHAPGMTSQREQTPQHICVAGPTRTRSRLVIFQHSIVDYVCNTHKLSWPYIIHRCLHATRSTPPRGPALHS